MNILCLPLDPGGHATFETTPRTWEEFDAGRLTTHRYVALGDTGQVAGWVACSATSTRLVYAGVVEHSVYVHPDHGGHGVGRTLIQTLIASTEAARIWTIQAGIFPENTASLGCITDAGSAPSAPGNASGDTTEPGGT